MKKHTGQQNGKANAELNRRKFIKMLGMASAALGFPHVSRAGTPARIVVIGGGFGGATVSKYLSLWGQSQVQVTLVDANASHVSCILSNLVVTGGLKMPDITMGFNVLQSKYGINLVTGRATEIDPIAKTVKVTTASGTTTLQYDRLVLSPGIEFATPAGNYDLNKTPHAWVAGPQTELLRNKLAALRTGGIFLMNIPKAPYRCPPGPYERACVVADYIRRKKRTGKVIVLDANPNIMAEPVSFGNAFKNTFRGIVQYIPNCSVLSVDSTAGILLSSQGSIRGDLVNYLPDMKAPSWLGNYGLLDAGSRWAVVDPLTYASVKYPEIHIIGDSQATAQPKSGTMANSQAKVCANAIIRALNGQDPNQNPVTMSACYSPITNTTASWLTASYQYDAATKSMKRVEISFGEAPRTNTSNLEDMFKWSSSLFKDCYA